MTAAVDVLVANGILITMDDERRIPPPARRTIDASRHIVIS